MSNTSKLDTVIDLIKKKVLLSMETEPDKGSEKVEVKLEQAKLDNGTVIEAEVWEQGSEVFIVNGEERVPLPVGTYTLEGGEVFTVEEDGVIASLGQKEEPNKEDVQEQEMEAEAPAETASSAPKKTVESVTKEVHFAKVEELELLKQEIRKELNDLKMSLQKKEEPKKEEVELSDYVPPIKHNPEGEAKKSNINLNKGMSSRDTKSVVFNKLFNK